MVLKFTVSGLRGIWNNGLDLELILKYTRSYLSYLISKGYGNRVAIASDTRKTSPLIKDFVSGIVRGCGFDVLDLGIITTPMVLFIVRKLGLDGGIIITASHNPPEWNALKFVDKGGIFVSQDAVQYISQQNLATFANWNRVGGIKNISCDESLMIFTETLEEIVDIDVIRRKKFRVGFDPVNGAGSVVGKMFLEYLGCEVVTVNYDVTKFPQRPTEPTEDALKDLSRVVVEERCDIGFALDPDGDRLALVLENGKVPGEEYTLPISIISSIKNFYKDDFSKSIVINLSTSSMSEYVARKFGFSVFRSKVGEANVVDMLKEIKGFIGGEGNGGVIFPLINTARDSFVGITLILYLLAKENLKISDVVSDFPDLKMVKRKFDRILSKNDIDNIVKNILKRFEVKERVSIDGEWYKFDSGWLHIRSSNTEPITRVIFEGSQEFC
ncbi:MAG: hypothetical protein ACK4F9_07305, partial [Brevinematia bacterium]